MVVKSCLSRQGSCIGLPGLPYKGSQMGFLNSINVFLRGLGREAGCLKPRCFLSHPPWLAGDPPLTVSTPGLLLSDICVLTTSCYKDTALAARGPP